MPPKGKQKAVKSATKPIPPPFSPADPSLAPLLETFDPSIVYIIHTDAHPAWFKKRIFSIPVGLNLLIVAILAWRAYVIIPFYYDILASLAGYSNHTTIYYAEQTWGGLIWKVVQRMVTFFIDYVLVMVIAPWPYGFFLEAPGNPVRWRWTVGFRDEEVYVRQSRGWGAKDLLGEAEESTGKAGEESPFFKTRILPAVDPQRLKEKTGYLLMDGDFDLDFYGMIAATQLLDRKDVAADLLKKCVLVYVGDREKSEGQWAVWNCGMLDVDEPNEAEAREKVIAIKDKLTEMGKESLFFRWVELIQYESNAPGGFTQERQVAAAEKVRKMFEEQGVDWDKFSQEIGGLEGVPGL
ncbi:hypothetical protein E8E12_004680 [Didymella heteroderae]|uniref:Uncharacterized protein n=1 Tax=Didymella heteroderae TaxID=1769908 RepID=A0A9P4WUH8_9PLEO|nr:hypothetical protein E8E12_004680 [Didymella heteroderae]